MGVPLHRDVQRLGQLAGRVGRLHGALDEWHGGRAAAQLELRGGEAGRDPAVAPVPCSIAALMDDAIVVRGVGEPAGAAAELVYARPPRDWRV